ncbi:MAG: J domain-containing protein [Desulfobaccales bacterium]
MTLEEARELLGLDLKATRKEIRAAYRRAARSWHPDRAPAGREEEYREKMQQVNAAHQRVIQFLEEYRFELVDHSSPEDVQQWWRDRFFSGVWAPPPRPDPEEDQE